MSDCGFFERRGIKTTRLSEWRAIHDSHVGAPDGMYQTKALDGAPEGYAIHWLVCTCGARLAVKDERSDGVEVKR